MVIAIAPSIEERSRLATALEGTSLVLLVSSPTEALEFLHGATSVATPWRPGVASPAGSTGGSGSGSTLEATVETPAATTAGERGETKGDLVVDSDSRVARCGDREVGLTPLEHDMLVCLLERLGRIETFESLQRQVWGNDHLGGRSHVQSVVKRLRRKLTELESPLQIDAVRGVGLRLVDVARDRGLEPAVADRPPVAPSTRPAPTRL